MGLFTEAGNSRGTGLGFVHFLIFFLAVMGEREGKGEREVNFRLRSVWGATESGN